MKRKNILVLIITVILVISLVGCATTTSTIAPATNKPSSGTTAAGTTSTTLKKVPPLELSAMIVLYEQPPLETSDFWLDMEAKNNVNYQIEWVASSSYTEKLSLVLATGTKHDILQIPDTKIPNVINAINDKFFKQLDSYLDPVKYPNLDKISSNSWINSKVNGKSYVVPRSRGHYNMGLHIRGDWLDKLGMKVPTTRDEFTQYVKGVSTLSKTYVALSEDWQMLVNLLQDTYGPGRIKPVFTNTKDGIVRQELTESFVLAVGYLQKLYTEGYYSKDMLIAKEEASTALFDAGLGGMYYKNLWHAFRLEGNVKKVDSNAYLAFMQGLKGEGGTSAMYDTGIMGGYGLNAAMDDAKVKRILEFFNNTSDPNNYNYFMYGIEGKYWTKVNDFPVLTEQGKREVTNSFLGPFVLSTDLYNKVFSPLAPVEYNKKMFEKVKGLDTLVKEIGASPFNLFSVISSDTWSKYWSGAQANFDAYVAETITGQNSLDGLRKYQQKILADPLVQKAFVEYKASYDQYGLANWVNPTK